MTEFPADFPECPVSLTAAAHPDRIAIATPDRSITYLEFDRIVTDVARKLRMQDTNAGRPVAVWFDNDWRYAVLLWSLLRIGAPMVPLNRREPVRKLQTQANLAGCSLLIGDLPDTGICQTALSWDGLVEAPHQSQTKEPDVIPRFSLSAPATIVFTSGSTGTSKGVLHTLENHWYSALGSQSVIKVDADTRWLVPLPFYHVGGLSVLFRCFLHGGCVVLPKDLTLADAIDVLSPTHISLVPTQLHRLLESDETQSLSRLRCVLVGGGRIPSSLIARAVSSGVRIRTTYGLTEMASQVSTTSELGLSDDLSTSGRTLPFRELRLSRDGLVQVRGRTLFSGYVVEDGRLQEPFDTDGWFSTGDIGRFDHSGQLTIVGRKDTMFVSGGENVYPEEIEDAILSSGLVEQAVVVSVADEEFGARPVAFVSPLRDVKPLTAFLKSCLAGFKIPIRFLELPTDIGRLKPDRTQLAALAAR